MAASKAANEPRLVDKAASLQESHVCNYIPYANTGILVHEQHCLPSLPPLTASPHCLPSLPPLTASPHWPLLSLQPFCLRVTPGLHKNNVPSIENEFCIVLLASLSAV